MRGVRVRGYVGVGGFGWIRWVGGGGGTLGGLT